MDITTADKTRTQDACCAGAPPPSDATIAPGDTRFRIAAMDCIAEESEIRRALDRLPDIGRLHFDLPRRILTIAAPETVLPQVVAAIGRVGFKAVKIESADRVDPMPASGHDQSHSHSDEHGHEHADHGGAGMPRLVAALLFGIGAELLSFLAFDSTLSSIAGMGLAGIAIALAGFDTYRKGLTALRHGRLNINALMTVAVTGAFLIGQWPEAAMVMALYAIAELIEARAVGRARNAVKSLLAMAPEDAEVRQSDGRWLRVPADAVAVGSVIRLRPGERVPLDGVVSVGSGAVDESTVTGESLAVDKSPGDAVFSGTINQATALEIRTTARASDSTLARIIHAVEQAQGSRAPTQRFVDRFAAIYTPAVFVLAVAVAVSTPWLMDWTWSMALYKALVLLVIACPCALVISTPVSVVSGLASAARRGILIKGGVHLEAARNLKVLALDKTGTITEGRPQLVAFEVIDPDADEGRLRELVNSLAARSDHPVSVAISRGIDAAAHEVAEFAAFAGRGVSGLIDGAEYLLANHRWVEERGQCSPAVEARLRVHEAAGRSVSLLVGVGGVLALCAVADRIRPSAKAAIAELIRLGVRPVMLTGDNHATARTIAAEAGIAEVHAGLLPEDKLAVIADLQTRFGATGMAGDGINDAPALAKADIGFAMGGAGTNTAMDAADIVVMNDELPRIAETIRLSRRTHVVLWQNIGLAMGIKALFLLLAIFGNATMWMAVFADMGASLLVVFNGLRLLNVPTESGAGSVSGLPQGRPHGPA